MVRECEPFRLLHLISSHKRRGAELFATRLAKSLQSSRIENAICSLYRSGSAPDPELSAALQVFDLNGPSNGVGALASYNVSVVRRFARALAHYKPQFVIAHGGDTLKYGALTKLFSRNTATIYKNINTATFWVNGPARLNFNRLLLRGFDAVVSVSEHTKGDFISLYRMPPERVTFIPNGVDIGQFDKDIAGLARARVRQMLGLPESAMVLTTVAALTPVKGHEELLQLMAGLDNAQVDSHLLVVGDGPLRQNLEEQSRQLGLEGRVHFLGTRSDVPRLLVASDLFALATRDEGMPAVLIEAGLAGLPSVAYDVGGVAEVVEHGVTGLVVRPGDSQGFSQGVASLVQDPQLRLAMGMKARQRCCELFDLRKVAGLYESFLRNMMMAHQGEANGKS